jgi:hypothetical protein
MLQLLSETERLQRKYVGSAAENTVAATLLTMAARSVRPGALLVFIFRTESAVHTTTVSDNVGGVWRVFQANPSPADATPHIAYAWNHPGGSTIVTAAFSVSQSAAYMYGGLYEFTGGDTVDPLIENSVYTYGGAGIANTSFPARWVPWYAMTFHISAAGGSNQSGTSGYGSNTLLSGTYVHSSLTYPLKSFSSWRNHKHLGGVAPRHVFLALNPPKIPWSGLWLPSGGASAIYTLNSATYVPGSITSSGVTPRINRTKA